MNSYARSHKVSGPFVRDFINDVIAHWHAWHVSPTDITNDITLRLYRGERVSDFWAHHQLSSPSPCFFLYLPHGFALFGWSLNMAYPSSKSTVSQERRGERTTSYGRGYFLVSYPLRDVSMGDDHVSMSHLPPSQTFSSPVKGSGKLKCTRPTARCSDPIVNIKLIFIIQL
ncbi:unnamed protein product [Penicillium viridicatum]